MATMKVSCSTMCQRVGAVRPKSVPALPSRRCTVRVQAKSELSAEVSKAAAVSSVAASLLYSGNAMAAQEMVGTIADSDNRLGIILTLFVPMLGWVGFNMLQPVTNQLTKMADERDSAQRSIVSAIGMGAAAASMLVAQNAEAATHVAQIAESDNRVGILLTLFVPVLGWVGFNMLQPVINQLTKMADERDLVQRGIVSAIGMGAAAASMLVAQNAEAATQVAQIAESDNRVGILLTLFVPVLGWVGFNMLQPVINQLNKMSDERDDAKR